MPRPQAPDLTREWKIHLPATLAGKIEYLLFDRILNKPQYGSRSKLLTALLEYWLALEEGRKDLPHIPSSDELRIL